MVVYGDLSHSPIPSLLRATVYWFMQHVNLYKPQNSHIAGINPTGADTGIFQEN